MLLEFYTDEAGDTRWRLKAANGKIIGASSEGYADPEDAMDNADQLASALMLWKLEGELGEVKVKHS